MFLLWLHLRGANHSLLALSRVCFPSPICNHVNSVSTLFGRKNLFSLRTWSGSRVPHWAVLRHILYPITEDNSSITPKAAAAMITPSTMACSLCSFVLLYPRLETLGLGFSFFLENYSFQVYSKDDQNI